MRYFTNEEGLSMQFDTPLNKADLASLAESGFKEVPKAKGEAIVAARLATHETLKANEAEVAATKRLAEIKAIQESAAERAASLEAEAAALQSLTMDKGVGAVHQVVLPGNAGGSKLTALVGTPLVVG